MHGTTIIKECAEELSTYKMALDELTEHETMLDDESRRILQEKGVLPQEIANHHAYGNSVLTGDKMRDLFKKVKEYSSRQSFRQVIEAELDEIYSLNDPGALVTGSESPGESLAV